VYNIKIKIYKIVRLSKQFEFNENSREVIKKNIIINNIYKPYKLECLCVTYVYVTYIN